MNQTRTQRIHRGFHRVGAVLAGILFVLGFAGFAIFAIEEPDKPQQMLIPLGGFSASALVVYILSRAVGWVIAGFAGE